MRIFVESLKRLYKEQKVTKDKIISLFDNKKLTLEEMMYILG